MQAEPWIDTSDIYLKANIQLLADSGHIVTPVTTYPLMWHDIARDLKQVVIEELSTIEKNAYVYVNYQLQLAKKNSASVNLSLASSNIDFTSFGDNNHYQHSIQIQTSFLSDNFALNISPGYAYSENGDNKFIYDGSYIATSLGNWSISLGKQERWFGSMWDTSFSLSSNAQPIPALSLSRISAEPFKIPFTEQAIPWTMTTFMGLMDDDRVINNALLWGFRLNFKPFKNLEIGISRLAQWGGKSNPTGLCNFWDILIGKTNGEVSGSSSCNNGKYTIANQQAGFDFRYSTTLFRTPIGFYGNYFAEDGANESQLDLNFVTKAEIQLGFDTQLDIFNTTTTAYVEYGDSLADCGEREGKGDCYYEHSTYRTGLRYNGRALGNLYDNDAETIVIGAISQLQKNIKITTKLRWLNLNYDNSDLSPNNSIIGNPLTSIAKKTIMLSVNMVHNYKNWEYILGGDFSSSNFKNNINDKRNANIYINVVYRL
tara:strand:+ start:958 stop:2415 length:1458 start_codon:yes stop_codon:yes gene_type:complete